jgi:hypothetical protein
MRHLIHGLAALATLTLASAVRADTTPRFPPGAVWNQDISQATPHPQSGTMISSLAALGGFGFSRMQIDFGLQLVRAPAGAPTRAIVAYPGEDYYSPDCEAVGSRMPVPTNAAIEAVDGLTCDNNSEDCHLLVVQGEVLYEAYKANASGNNLEALCLAVWKLDRVYQASNRGEHCTSADAAGFPIAPLLFNADDVYAAMQVTNGDLGHAIRFILPNPRMASTLVNGVRNKFYVRPGSHAGGPSGPETTVPYGSRLRLRSDFPVSMYPPAAQVVLRTMQRYGIVLADGGNIALTAESDRYTTRKWSDVGLTARVFDQAVPSAKVVVQDFTVLDTGPRILETYDCVRNPEPPPPTTTAPSAPGAVIVQAGLKQPMVIELRWTGGATDVSIQRNGQLVRTLTNTNLYVEKYFGGPRPGFRVCNAGTTTCSPSVLTPALRRTGPVPATPPPVAAKPLRLVEPAMPAKIGRKPVEKRLN